ncbi:MAG TPA: glycosyltransferase [Flavobacteriales bacterium]|nr:glycosyltransferase [Flavobacteriales bacterium]
MIAPLYSAFALFGVAMVQAVILAAWRERLRAERGRRTGEAFTKAGATVIVPARNAEHTLIPLLQDLNAQDLPKEQLQVLVVDDGSEDATARIVEGMRPQWPQLELLRNTGEGKKAAITNGVHHARNELIILTDADARCGRERIRTILAAMEEGQLDMIVLPVRTVGAGGFLGRLQEEEQAGLLGVAMGQALSGRAGLAYGANLAFRRSAFFGVNGYQGDRFVSGDDMFLLKRMQRAGKRIGVRYGLDAAVSVDAEVGLRGFITQRLRWAGKMRGVGGAFTWVGLFLLLLPWFLLVFTMRVTAEQMMAEDGVELFSLLFAAWALWSIPVVALVSEVRRGLQQRVWPLVSVFCYVLFTVYAPLIALVSVFYRPRWKGRRT